MGSNFFLKFSGKQVWNEIAYIQMVHANGQLKENWWLCWLPTFCYILQRHKMNGFGHGQLTFGHFLSPMDPSSYFYFYYSKSFNCNMTQLVLLVIQIQRWSKPTFRAIKRNRNILLAVLHPSNLKCANYKWSILCKNDLENSLNYPMEQFYFCIINH